MIEINNISKYYRKHAAVKNASLSIQKEEIFVIIGESGSGKTTMLKMLNKLISPTEGNICINGVDIATIDDIELRRNIGYVIQQTGLFPHMTVKQNIELILKVNKWSKEDMDARTLELLKMVDLDSELLYQYPDELSGGQQQRVGVARAFASNPEIILMDEPFSALDPLTRSDLQDELLKVQSEQKKSIVFVTHDMSEAIKIADRICIMKDGCVLQCDTPENILKYPVNEYVRNFVGKNRLWSRPDLIKAVDIMNKEPVTSTLQMTQGECMEKMRLAQADSLLVLDRDIITARPSDSILDILKLMRQYHISDIPIVSETGKLEGIVTTTEIATTLSRQYLQEGDE